jgi:hypothetical protein
MRPLQKICFLAAMLIAAFLYSMTMLYAITGYIIPVYRPDVFYMFLAFLIPAFVIMAVMSDLP